MQFKKYLFFASLVLLVGCDDNEAIQRQIEIRLDSLHTANQRTLDSLGMVVSNYESEIMRLKDINEVLTDSLKTLKESENKKKAAPKVKMYPGSKGDPIDIPLKK